MDNSLERRHAKLKSLGTSLIVIRFYRNYSCVSKEYRIFSSSEKYVACIRLRNVYDLTSLYTNK